jgi:hypothetical protein
MFPRNTRDRAIRCAGGSLPSHESVAAGGILTDQMSLIESAHRRGVLRLLFAMTQAES